MVAGSKRTRTVKRVNRVTPSGKSVVRYKAKKKGQAKCQITGTKLSGVPRDVRNKSKSSKRPTRPFGGVLSPVAMKRVLISKVRDEE